jgi:hypothetical protein
MLAHNNTFQAAVPIDVTNCIAIPQIVTVSPLVASEAAESTAEPAV